MTNVLNKKKLIEVALPLEAISVAASHEKSVPRAGHPATLHLWWARRPLAACRAVLFAQLVDDPSSHPEEFPTEEAQEQERKRLFGIIENLVKWENSNNEQVLNAARAEIMKSCNGKPPAVLDPFCGGGSIPLEAQRLGLKAYASDLNPVAVLITKALIEIPPKFANKPPVNPESRKKMIAGSYKGAQGLAEDVRHYGKWMRDEAEKRIGHIYPKVKVTAEMARTREDLKGLVGKELTVIAWLWTRTVKCSNPACGARMPMVRSFQLSTKNGKEAWVEPVTDRSAKTVTFRVHAKKGKVPLGTKLKGKGRCLICGIDNLTDATLREQASDHGISEQLLTVVADGRNGRVYLDPTSAVLPANLRPPEVPWLRQNLPTNARWFSPPGYGLTTFRDLFTPRQLVSLTTFSDLVGEVHEQVLNDARAAGMPDDSKGVDQGGTSSTAYADAVAMYLAFAVDKLADWSSSICSWIQRIEGVRDTFARQALPMVWDFCEINPLSNSVGNFLNHAKWVADSVSKLAGTVESGVSAQLDVIAGTAASQDALIATDPPYYDNIGYADLSDFFYVWLRRSVGKLFPQLFSTLLVPKAQELIATPYRFGGSREKAHRFFEEGLGAALAKMRDAQNSDYPLTLFYAFKQAESEEGEDDGSAQVVSTGWETMLEGLVRARLQITGTWPMRTERSIRTVSLGTNSLASSIVLACRPRPDDAPLATRREFLKALKDELPDALRNLQFGNIAPVDLAQAAIGPSMAVFSRYSKVLETDGSAMTVRAALGIINHALDEVLAEQEGDYDSETRWAVAWFGQFGTSEGKFGDAETLSRAKDTAVNALEEAGIIKAKAGKVQLVARDKMNPDWDPASEPRVTIWELTQHLIRALEAGGEASAARIIRRTGGLAEAAKDLAYRLFVICDRKGWSQEALAYNMLVKSWPELQKLAAGTVGVTGELSPSAR